jgi:CO/xanthine dehydrogenase Mo-binding subunit
MPCSSAWPSGSTGGKPLARGNGALRRGRGIAVAIKAVISPTTSVANLAIAADGSTTLYCGTVDMGQGSDTAMAQIAGEVLDIPGGERAHRAARHRSHPLRHGHARLALALSHGPRGAACAQEAREKIKRWRARSASPKAATSAARPVQEAVRHAGRHHLGTGTYKPDYVPPDPATGLTDNVTPFWMCAASGAEVEVDTETGHVRIARLITAVDCGRPVNPKIVETQISGASLMQLGFTMFEKMHLDAGQVTNASLADYKFPASSTCRRSWRTSRWPRTNRTVRSAPRAWARPRPSAFAGDRQCDRGRLRRAPHRASAQREAVFRALRAKADNPLGDADEHDPHHQLHPQRRAGHGRDQAAP